MTFEENYQSRKTLLANQLTNKEVNASDTEGMTTLINKVNDIQPETNNTLVLYADKNTAENGEDIQLYALLINNNTPVSGVTIYFSLNDIHIEEYVNRIYCCYKTKGDGQIDIGTGTSMFQYRIFQNDDIVDGGSKTTPASYKIEDSKLYEKSFSTPSWREVTQWGGFAQFDGSQPTDFWIETSADITANTFMYGSATTNEYGIATLPYTCTGEGIQKITANYKNFISNSLEITDALFYDDGLTDAKWDTHYTGVTLNRQITNEGTELSSNGDYLYCYLSVNGEQDWVHENIQIDFDFTLKKINNPWLVFYVGYEGYNLSSYDGEGHLRVIIQDGLAQFFINDNKVHTHQNQYPTSLSFQIYRAGSITYKNLIIKKI